MKENAEFHINILPAALLKLSMWNVSLLVADAVSGMFSTITLAHTDIIIG